MPLPDNRIKLSSTLIDFDADVGVASQDHDDFPDAGQQARYDWMRIYLIGLLSNQSSFDEPSQYRDGTIWFDLNTLELKIRMGMTSDWRPMAEAIAMESTDEEAGDSTIFTLAEWYSSVSDTLNSFAPEITYGGSSSNDGVAQIPIPDSLRTGLFNDSRPFVYVNGLLIDPRLTALEPSSNPTAVQLTNTTLSDGDAFTVLIKRMPAANFYIPDVNV